MNDAVAIILLILICLQLLVILPRYFISKNGRQASQTVFDNYIKELLALDKKLAGLAPQLQQNLNVVNYWLKTGYDPTAEETPEEKKKRELDAKRYARGEMTPTEAEQYRLNKSKSRSNFDIIDINTGVKSRRKNVFDVSGMDPCEVDISEMQFIYDGDYVDHIYYCVTKEAFEKKFYSNVIYFTTARPSQIPLTYPHKYEGAQMLSLYKHPGHAVWFLKNWKLIRDALEVEEEVEVPEEFEDVISEFDL